jgi:AcrR family transcriptional regulator
MATRKRLSAEERREIIEAAAVEVFARHGYRGASIGEIVKRAGVSPPVFYDHFASKEALYRHLLERHYADLRAIWADNLPGPEPAGVRIHRAFDAWFAYVEEHQGAARMLFGRATGDPDYEAIHGEVTATSRDGALHLLVAEAGTERIAGADLVGMQLAWEVFRVTLQGLALWWFEHPEVPRAQMSATAMNALWLGFERVSSGESWS